MIARARLERATALTVSFGVLVAACAGLVTSCSIPDASRITTVGGTTGPNEELYATYVDPYLARRCATLDCHGQVGRPLRLYSQLGLRQSDAGVASPGEITGFRGGIPTTDAEKLANYQAIVGLQPEVMAQVVSDLGDKPERLLLLLKPLNLIPHKGGDIMNQGTLQASDTDAPTLGYDCVVDWLQGGVTDIDPKTGIGTVDPIFVNACAGATAAP